MEKAEGTGGLLVPGPRNHRKVFALTPSEAGAAGGATWATSVSVTFLW